MPPVCWPAESGVAAANYASRSAKVTLLLVVETEDRGKTQMVKIVMNSVLPTEFGLLSLLLRQKAIQGDPCAHHFALSFHR